MDELAKFFTPLIAWVLPGLTGLYGLSFHVPIIRVWFGTAADKDTTVGGFFFVVLASLAVGLVLSGIRWLVLESEKSPFRRLMPPRPAFNYEKRRDEKADAAVADIRAQHFAHYLFYSNMAFALIAVFICWQVSVRPPWIEFAEAAVALVLI